MIRSKTFLPFSIEQSQLVYDLSENAFPANLYTWQQQPLALEQKNATFFGFIHTGKATLSCAQGKFEIAAGMFFCVPEQLGLSGTGQGFVIEQQAFKGWFQLGGPIEQTGRLRYIDGCTDSLLLAPPVLGNPCFNLLNIPAQTFQSQHTHPSFRIGMIVKGTGTCISPEGTFPLAPGRLFVIPENALHSFKTTTEELLIVAYHPDSDFGPTHENHPMINRTILEQVKA